MRAKRTADGKTSSKCEKTLPVISTFTQLNYSLFQYWFVQYTLAPFESYTYKVKQAA